MQNFPEIPRDKPYSIVIFECFFPQPYRVEGCDWEEAYVLGYGTLEECNTHFDKIKTLLTEEGNGVHEVGCSVSKTQVPRNMLINCSPYHVWKAIYLCLQAQPSVREVDKVLTQARAEVNRMNVPDLMEMMERARK